MKFSKMHALAVVIGVIVGFAALWAGAAPAIGDGDSVLGGHPQRWYFARAFSDPDMYVGCNIQGGCDFCLTEEWRSCSGYYDGINHPCSGGSILIAVDDFEYERTDAGYKAGCSGTNPDCAEFRHAGCML